MLMDDANALADKLRDSDEYKHYLETKARAYENPSTAALLDEFTTLRNRVSANAVTGQEDELAQKKLQKMGELLQFDSAAAEFLMAEYRLNDLLGGIYRVLAKAVGFDLDA